MNRNIPEQTNQSLIYFDNKDEKWIVNGLKEAKIILESSSFRTAKKDELDQDTSSFFLALSLAKEKDFPRLKKSFSRNFTPSKVLSYSKDYFKPVAFSLVRQLSGKHEINCFYDYVEPYCRQAIFRLLGIENDKGNEILASIKIAQRYFHQEGLSSIKGRFIYKMISNNIKEMLNDKSLISDHDSLIHNIQKDHSLYQKERVAFIFPFFEMLASKMTHELPFHLIIKLASHRVVQQRVRENPEELSKVVDEVARGLEGLMLTRFAKEDVEINGKQIKKGDKVVISITHTNKDNRVFKNSRLFNPWRLESKESLTFGAGEHRCLGKGIAIHLSMKAVQALIVVTEFIEPGGDIHHIRPLWKPFEK